MTAKALDLRGRETSIKSSFKTFTPEKELTITTNVWDGATFGVGLILGDSLLLPAALVGSAFGRLIPRFD